MDKKTSFERDGAGRLADGVWKREAGVSNVPGISALEDWVDGSSILGVKEKGKATFTLEEVGHHGFDFEDLQEWMLIFS